MVNVQDLITRRQGNRVTVKTGRGGSTVNLSIPEFNRALQLAQSGQKSFFGEPDRRLKKFAGFILAETRRRGAVVKKDALLRKLGEIRQQSLNPNLFSIGDLQVKTGKFTKQGLINLIERSRQQSIPGLRDATKKQLINVATGRLSISQIPTRRPLPRPLVPSVPRSRIELLSRAPSPLVSRQSQIKARQSRIREFIFQQVSRRADLNRGELNRISNFASAVVKTKDFLDDKTSERLKKAGLTDENISKISKFLEETPPFPQIQRASEKIGEKVKDEKTKKVSKRISKTSEEAIKLRAEVTRGFAKEVRDKPTEAAVSFGVGRVAPPIVKFLGGTKVFKAVSRSFPGSVKRVSAKVIPKALLATYLASSGIEVAQAPPGTRAEAVGGKISTEVIPFIVGTKRGVRGLLRKELKKEIEDEVGKLPIEKRAAFNELLKKSNVLEKTKTTVRDVDLSRLKRIPDKAKAPILKFLKKEDIIIGGSLGQQTAVRVKRTLAQSDLDLYTEGDAVAKAKKLTSLLKKRGIERVSQVKDSKGRLTGRVTIKGKKAAEFHDIDRLLANIESVIPGWKNPKSFIIRTKGGIRVPKITVQLKRKIVGGFTDPKREKDLKDSKDILEQLFKRAELQARNKFFFKEKNIKELEKTFGVKINRKPSGIIKVHLPTTKFKKPITIKRTVSSKRLGGVGKGIKISKQLKAKKIVKLKKIKKPSQPATKRPSRVSLSQRKIRRTKGRVSQPPRRPPRRPSPPSQPPRRPPRRPFIPGGPPPRIPDRPSQPPVKPPRRPPPPTGPPPTRPPTKPPTKGPPPLKPEIKRKIKKRKKAEVGFHVLAKSRNKFIRLNRLPLTKKDALSRGAFAIDNTTARTMKIIPASKARKLGTIKKKERGHFSRNKSKLRNFKIVKGKRKPLRNTFIERTKHNIDTRGEKKQLSIARFVKREGFLKRRRSTTVSRGIPKPRRAPIQKRGINARRTTTARRKR